MLRHRRLSRKQTNRTAGLDTLEERSLLSGFVPPSFDLPSLSATESVDRSPPGIFSTTSHDSTGYGSTGGGGRFSPEQTHPGPILVRSLGWNGADPAGAETIVAILVPPLPSPGQLRHDFSPDPIPTSSLDVAIAPVVSSTERDGSSIALGSYAHIGDGPPPPPGIAWVGGPRVLLPHDGFASMSGLGEIVGVVPNHDPGNDSSGTTVRFVDPPRLAHLSLHVEDWSGADPYARPNNPLTPPGPGRDPLAWNAPVVSPLDVLYQSISTPPLYTNKTSPLSGKLAGDQVDQRLVPSLPEAAYSPAANSWVKGAPGNDVAPSERVLPSAVSQPGLGSKLDDGNLGQVSGFPSVTVFNRSSGGNPGISQLALSTSGGQNAFGIANSPHDSFSAGAVDATAKVASLVPILVSQPVESPWAPAMNTGVPATTFTVVHTLGQGAAVGRATTTSFASRVGNVPASDALVRAASETAATSAERSRNAVAEGALGNSGKGEDSSSPETAPIAFRAAELIAGFSPFEQGSLEKAIDQFLGQLDDLDGGFTRLTASASLVPSLVEVALVICAAEMARRRFTPSRDDDDLAAADDDLAAFLGLPVRPGSWALEE